MFSKKKMSLGELSKELSNWRKSGRLGRKVPKELKNQAVELLSEHKASEITKALRINTQMLKDWQQDYDNDSSAPFFISLPSEPVNISSLGSTKEEKPFPEILSLKISRDSNEGTSWSLEGSLLLVQWNEAISLLERIKQ